MNRLKTVLKDRSGQGTPMILAVVVCCMILACVVFEYMRLMIVARWQRRIGMKPTPACGKGIRAATSFPVRPGRRM